MGFAQSRSPLDMDATLVETRKQEALPSYKKYRAYQPLITYWSEAELIVHSDSGRQVPAGHQTEALGRLPAGVEKVMLRSDVPAGVAAVLRGGWRRARGDRVCGWGRRDDGVPPCGVRGQDWQTLYRKVGEHRVDKQWAENFVPNWIGHSRTAYRFIATRERLIEHLPGNGRWSFHSPRWSCPTEAGTTW